jgi:hypothetical protein
VSEINLYDFPLHYNEPGLQCSFGGAFEKLVNFSLSLLADLLMSTFLAHRARDILDLNRIFVDRRPAQISPRAALSAFPGHGIQCNAELNRLPSPLDKALRVASPE